MCFLYCSFNILFVFLRPLAWFTICSCKPFWMQLQQFILLASMIFPLPPSVATPVVQLKLETIRTLSREPGHRKFTADVLEYKQMRIYQSASQINKGSEQMCCSPLLSPLVRQAVITTTQRIISGGWAMIFFFGGGGGGMEKVVSFQPQQDKWIRWYYSQDAGGEKNDPGIRAKDRRTGGNSLLHDDVDDNDKSSTIWH